MTDFEGHPPIDDELLSAYLDDELSAEERASVDARLASDPRARQLLDELRMASHAVRDLPHQTIGHDLRESILRRAEEAMLAPSRARPEVRPQPAGTVQPDGVLPRLTIGRTKRGWAWAALATAAGLMIMFWYPGERQEGNRFPAVAQKRGEPSEDLASASRRAPAELRQWRNSPASEPARDEADRSSLAESETAASPRSGGHKPAPGSVALDFATPSAPEPGRPAGGAMEEAAAPSGELAGAPSGASRPPVEGGQGRYARGTTISGGARVRTVDASPSEPAQAVPEGDETPFDIAADSQPVRDNFDKNAPTDDDLLIVHVVVNDKAVESRSFDRLLADHGIVLEEPQPAEGRSSVSGAEAAQAGARVQRELDRLSARQPDVEEAVLVVAPRATIESCLAELKQDEANYLGLAVDEAAEVAATTGVKLELADESRRNGLAEELGRRFGRGTAAAKSDKQAVRFYVGDLFSGGQQSETGGGGLGGTSGAAPSEQAAGRRNAQNRSSLESLSQGHARRLAGRGLSSAAQPERPGPDGGESRSASRQRQLEKLRQEAKNGPDSPAEPLYVLFVLLPEPVPADGAPSPAAENRPE